MSSVSKLKISYVFNAAYLAENRYESDPYLLWWNTTNRRWSTESPIIMDKSSQRQPQHNNHHQQQQLLSSKHTVEIELVDVSNMRSDDSVYFQCIVFSPNQDLRYVRSKAGHNKLYLRDIYKEVVNSLDISSKSGTRTVTRKYDLFMPTFIEEETGEMLKKGEITIEIRVDDLIQAGVLRWSFAESVFDLTPGNTENIRRVVEGFVEKTMFPFSTKDKRTGKRNFKPSRKEIGRIHAPFYVNEAFAIPGLYYWIDHTQHKPDENFFLNLVKIALGRNNMTEKDFVRCVEAQFNDTTSTHISEDFMRCLIVMMDVICIPSVSLPYIGDYTYTSRRGEASGRNAHSEKMSGGNEDTGEEQFESRVSIESFHDALRLLAGDCEDLARLIFVTMTTLEIGRSEYADETVSYKKHGSWESRTLRCLQRIAHIYVGMGTLGSVTSRYLGEDDAKNGGKEKKGLPLINSDEDNNAEVGAHMWFEAVPLKYVEECLEKTGNSNNDHGDAGFRLYPDDFPYPWLSDLPLLVGEGTGYMNALLRAADSYFLHDVSTKLKWLQESISYTDALKKVLPPSKMLKRCTFKRPQNLVQDVEGSRLSSFYREAIHCYTDKFMREGFDFGQFSWTYLNGSGASREKHSHSSRSKEEEELDNASYDEWTWGVSMRERIHNHHSKSEIGLVVIPGYNEVEIDVIKSINRHIPPRMNFVLPSSTIHEKNIRELSTMLNQKFKQIVKGETRNDSKLQNVNLYFRSPFLLEKEYQDMLLSDVEQIKGFVSDVILFVEPILSDVYVIRIQLSVIISSNNIRRLTINSNIGSLVDYFTEETEANKIVFGYEKHSVTKESEAQKAQFTAEIESSIRSMLLREDSGRFSQSGSSQIISSNSSNNNSNTTPTSQLSSEMSKNKNFPLEVTWLTTEKRHPMAIQSRAKSISGIRKDENAVSSTTAREIKDTYYFSSNEERNHFIRGLERRADFRNSLNTVKESDFCRYNKTSNSILDSLTQRFESGFNISEENNKKGIQLIEARTGKSRTDQRKQNEKEKETNAKRRKEKSADGDDDDDDEEESSEEEYEIDAERHPMDFEGEMNYDFQSDSEYDYLQPLLSVKYICMRLWLTYNFILIEWQGEAQDDQNPDYSVYLFNTTKGLKAFRKTLLAQDPSATQASYKIRESKRGSAIAVRALKDHEDKFPSIFYVHEF